MKLKHVKQFNVMMNETILNETIVDNNLIVQYYDKQIDNIITFTLPTINAIKNVSKISINTYMVETMNNETFMIKFDRY